ncbi:hypothetical protein P170DRAFT_479534 [Aspergillus steynii IBT 23096]|uniref:Zn(2)-C6 fungal-type domain-containing protein n=1 Tax=Aspergillus steynii IBT 23096 TaxID=1392250 RepID=A0A2I2FWH9_9EURO|nr:uncharacterized protein P170DRAFT_479534 [Aspergillus steynii IBT 23096]PLB45003.1 hypothetical protein P170DRAFT_479534 [Aspergillus steynii IBT 23096]
MIPEPPGPPTLRRSCLACAKGKRRCDQRWPKCSRCQKRQAACEYANEPLTRESSVDKFRTSGITRARNLPDPRIYPSLSLEIVKGYDPDVIRFLDEGIRNFPVMFAENMKTMFIHPDLFEESSPPAAIREVHALCKLHVTATRADAVSLAPLLRRKSAQLQRQVNHTANFDELLGCIQALLLIQCILILDEDDTEAIPYSETVSTMLVDLAERLWQQAPIQLPNTLSPKRAWLFAESVRRTIIVGYLLRSVYSLKKRNYSVRNPFIDSLPFDVRVSLWDEDSAEVWSGVMSESWNSIMSLHQYSAMMENGQVHGIPPFGALILAACKGKTASDVQYPALSSYYVS